MDLVEDKKGDGMLKENISVVLDFLNPSWADISIFLIGTGIWFLLYLKGSLSFFAFLTLIPIQYLLLSLVHFIHDKLIWSKTSAGRESIKREKKIFKFR